MGGTRYQVRVSDCFHLFDESEIYTHRTFDNPDDAIAACRAIVDEGLEAGSARTAADTYRSWAQFGDSPWVVASDGSRVPFSACEYAKERSAVLAQPKN
jgi:hypothetical protein